MLLVYDEDDRLVAMAEGATWDDTFLAVVEDLRCDAG
jgi:hypothetical protein